VDDTIQAYDYDLPEALIAQHPSPERGHDRLMVVRRSSGEILHHHFHELPVLLREGDLLVVNDTRVIPARVMGKKATGGNVELLLVKRLDEEGRKWRCMARRVARMREGMSFHFLGGVEGNVLKIGEEGTIDLEFSLPLTDERLRIIGELPLPPYISRPEGPYSEDYRRYQTIFARKPGAVAAPTAGLHFSPSLVEKLRERGIMMTSITLHVGPGTFLPVRSSKIGDHKMHAEFFQISKESSEQISLAKRKRQRIIAVGTTVVRALESAASGNHVRHGDKWTSLFIYPPYEFHIVDGMITNFHLPKSTLLLLVCSFASKSLIFKAYEVAKQEGYRFYSYGDAMLIV